MSRVWYLRQVLTSSQENSSLHQQFGTDVLKDCSSKQGKSRNSCLLQNTVQRTFVNPFCVFCRKTGYLRLVLPRVGNKYSAEPWAWSEEITDVNLHFFDLRSQLELHCYLLFSCIKVCCLGQEVAHQVVQHGRVMSLPGTSAVWLPFMPFAIKTSPFYNVETCVWLQSSS